MKDPVVQYIRGISGDNLNSNVIGKLGHDCYGVAIGPGSDLESVFIVGGNFPATNPLTVSVENPYRGFLPGDSLVYPTIAATSALVELVLFRQPPTNLDLYVAATGRRATYHKQQVVPANTSVGFVIQGRKVVRWAFTPDDNSTDTSYVVAVALAKPNLFIPGAGSAPGTYGAQSITLISPQGLQTDNRQLPLGGSLFTGGDAIAFVVAGKTGNIIVQAED